MRGFRNFKGSDARCPSIHFLFYDHGQGGRGNFTYPLEGQIHFALKLFVGRPIKQF